ncbi:MULTISPECIES: 16S rRNA (cytosine(1402)-N(4))-methyltransferase RsmH [Oscillospiraceae]|uniref:Ribosomal RNA small subunit methyltransferase H n=1 Tax=Harryflintia acetispora TaxID=1849041 RepID=A0A9X8UJM4_9FIRM|nr:MULTISPECIES: 16S rRNA (cytosine(1402)-N(4))-methyltransferase RsmH [Oscillospiraceae]RGB68260.1 16S rRNA (cytosine(1402)-N(4))-methyltransferase RsmH [Harryflintia acetispora]TCL43809.1 16S rRNA (cytosine1402-N4)-methyltransferase [Harryflintia acetispora]
MEFSHTPVLLHEAVEALKIRPDGVYVDGTSGGAGHSREIASRLQGGRLIALDKDPEAIETIKERLQGLPATVVQSDFRFIPEVLDELGIARVDGILLDLGVSSHQLDTAGRGFSYIQDAPLDMRMSAQGFSAYDLVNTWEEAEIARILWEYGEEKFSRRIAQSIVSARARAPVGSTLELAQLVKDSIPAPARRTGGNPAKRTFQAIRIAVNDELGSLRECLERSFERLAVGGRFAIITFHSLEDRMVKQKFAQLAKGCTCPPDCPVCICGKKPRGRLTPRKPVLPGEEELRENKRSHSARLRVIERIDE